MDTRAGVDTIPLRIPAGGEILEADLGVPADALGLVLFAHGSGSSRFSIRNRKVAADLRKAGLATLLMDLLTREEERRDAVTGEVRFDIDLLARRLAEAASYSARHPAAAGLPLGYFGASTGAAAALIAAALAPDAVAAVVSRGGRPDLAEDFLPAVRAPTLLLVGGRDAGVLELNREALARLSGEKALEIVPGATHLFEEPGALDTVAGAAARWFARHFKVPEAEASGRARARKPPAPT